MFRQVLLTSLIPNLICLTELFSVLTTILFSQRTDAVLKMSGSTKITLTLETDVVHQLLETECPLQKHKLLVQRAVLTIPVIHISKSFGVDK